MSDLMPYASHRIETYPNYLKEQLHGDGLS